MTSLLKIDTGSSRAEAALTERANEQSHVLRDRDTAVEPGGSVSNERGRATMNSLT